MTPINKEFLFVEGVIYHVALHVLMWSMANCGAASIAKR